METPGGFPSLVDARRFGPGRPFWTAVSHSRNIASLQPACPTSWTFEKMVETLGTWIGLREDLQETPWFLPSNIRVSCRFVPSSNSMTLAQQTVTSTSESSALKHMLIFVYMDMLRGPCLIGTVLVSSKNI